MFEPTPVTWILIVFGLITNGPLLYAQLIMLWKPHSEEAKALMIGKGEDWRDLSHFKSAYALARADWLLFTPLFIAGMVGVLFGQGWAYLLYGVAGSIQLYINLFLWFFEREYVYPTAGPMAYYTYLWGNFIYWGAASVVYALLRLNGIEL